MAVTDEERRALDLRVAGGTYGHIAQALKLDGAEQARELVVSALGGLTQDTAEEHRRLELARLDRMSLALWERARGGDRWAIDRCLAIAELRTRLMGDAPPAATEDGVDDIGRQRAKRLAGLAASANQSRS